MASTVLSHAQQDKEWTGAVSSNWSLAENWLGGRPVQTTDAIINTMMLNSTVVSDPGAIAKNVAVGQSATAILSILNGGTLSNSFATVGNLLGGQGTVTVTGAGSSWSNAGSVVIGGLGAGTLTIQDGGTVSSSGASVGLSAGSTGTVTVTGPGSRWTNGTSGGLNIGSFGTGSLAITNGGSVSNNTYNTAANIGNAAGSQGTVVVTGAGSRWSNTFGLNIGNFGTGMLTIADGGVVTGLVPTIIAANPGSTGTLNIGAGAGSPAASPGTLDTSILAFGIGTGTLNFNHNSSDYVFAPTIVDRGTVNVLAGTTIFKGANTYSGPTNVNGGTLRAGALNTFSPGSAVTVGRGGTLDLNGFNHTIVSIANAGQVSMGSGTAPGTALTTPGYSGSGGTIAMNAVLGADNSLSDKLVIAGGSAIGNSSLAIANAGGQGELTTGNGILVVDAVNGGTTSAGAFAVEGVVAAGPYEYQLFRGGVGGASPNSWFLRSTVEAPVTPEPPVPPVSPEPPVPPGTGTTPPDPTPPRPVIPLYRPEAALYTQVSGVARLLDLAMLSTFHKRQGDQSLLLGADTLPGSWGRIFGGRAEEHRSGLLSPEIEGNLWGFQVGQDLFGWDHDGHRDRFGLFLGHDRADLDGRGFALAQQRALVGNLKMNATSLAAYWTHVGPSSWYIDAVLMASWLDGNPRSTRGVELNADGTSFTASLEAGYPIPIGAGLVLEPQAQLISQHVDFENSQDSFAKIRFDSEDAMTGRIGARLVGEVESDGVVSKPYLFLNVWRNFDGTDTTTFNATPIPTSFGRTSLEFGGAISAQVSARVSGYADASYATNLGGDYSRGVKGNIGLRVTW